VDQQALVVRHHLEVQRVLVHLEDQHLPEVLVLPLLLEDRRVLVVPLVLHLLEDLVLQLLLDHPEVQLVLVHLEDQHFLVDLVLPLLLDFPEVLLIPEDLVARLIQLLRWHLLLLEVQLVLVRLEDQHHLGDLELQ